MNQEQELHAGRFVRAQERVQKAKRLITAKHMEMSRLERTGFYEEAVEVLATIRKLEDLLALCLEDRDDASREVTGAPVQ